MTKLPEISLSLIPNTEKLVYLFSKEYSALYDREDLSIAIQSLIWCSYRKSFPPIAVTFGPTSDSGWGCMYRVGQMVILNALQRILIQKNWSHVNEMLEDETYLSLLRLIGDKPDAPLSVHNITLNSGWPIGAHLSPDVLAFTLQHLWHDNAVDRSQFGWLKIVALNSSVVPLEDLRDAGHGYGELCSSSSSREPHTPKWQPILLFVPCMIMIGANCLLRSLISFPQSVGFLGGHNGRAMWIFGFIEDECFLALDPHVTQNSIDNPCLDNSTYHTTKITRLPLHHLEENNGSMAFLFKNENDLDNWYDKFKTQHFSMQEIKQCHCINVEKRIPKAVSIISYCTVESSDSCYIETNSPLYKSSQQLNQMPPPSSSYQHQHSSPTRSASFARNNEPVIRMNSSLLYNDWFGRLYRLTDSVKQLFHRDDPTIASSPPPPPNSPISIVKEKNLQHNLSIQKLTIATKSPTIATSNNTASSSSNAMQLQQ